MTKMLVTYDKHSAYALALAESFASINNYDLLRPRLADMYFYFNEQGKLSFYYRLPVTGQLHKLTVDFTSGKAAYRLVKNTTIKQPLARAAGIKGGFRPDIIDVTAGLGQDAFVLASLGCRVIMLERSPVLYHLLENGLHLAGQDPKTSEIVNKISLIKGDSLKILPDLPRPQTIYMDPMYPPNMGSALNKIEMRVIRELAGADQDAGDLLEISIKTAINRVAVKRPKRAKPIEAGFNPAHSIKLKNSRYDVYLS
ncbi:MAG: rRNA methyltransferase [Deltaproteobacteria bacterium]|nr:MAG: rRNA methyltransferase [Deltaproteobacteria bacterium]